MGTTVRRLAASLLTVLIVSYCGLAFGGSPTEVQVSATDQFEYSYSTETEREIVENWLDASFLLDDFRVGLLLNSRQPSEEGFRENEIRHRFFEFSRGDVDLRIGHFYGLFGRGLVFSAYENRQIRVDTALDGVLATVRRGPLTATVLSGTPSALDRDVRALDLETDVGGGWLLGASALTYFLDEMGVGSEGPLRIAEREWVTTGRISRYFDHGDVYAEYGWKSGYDYPSVLDGEPHDGHVFYGAANLYAGPVALALEAKDYDRFTVLRRADGTASLNKPPSLTREHVYALLGRHAHNLDADDEKGYQAELTWSAPREFTIIASGNRTRTQAGRTVFEEAYLQVEKERWGDFRTKAAFGFQDAAGLRQTGVGEATWLMDDRRSLTLIWEHQHVRPEDAEHYEAGAYDIDYLSLEFASSPSWSLTGLLEINNKYPGQRDPGEMKGPFPAVQFSYFFPGGDSIAVWAGKRQAGQLCSGGVCKYEPAFEGLEVYGLVRY